MKNVFVFLLCVATLFFASCMKNESDRQADPVVTEDFLFEDTLITMSPVEKVDGLNMGIVEIKRKGDGVPLFNAMVSPFYNIPVGSTVKVTRVRYQNRHGGMPTEFITVQ